MSRGIYQIICGPTGKRYIGSAACISSRWGHHRAFLRAGKHANPHLQSAWNKYGEAAFQFNVLELVDGDLLVAEQAWIDSTAPEFNMIKAGAPPMLGKKHTPESRAKMSAFLLGRKASPETRAKMSAKRLGHAVSSATRARIAEGLRARARTMRAQKALSWLLEGQTTR